MGWVVERGGRELLNQCNTISKLIKKPFEITTTMNRKTLTLISSASILFLIGCSQIGPMRYSQYTGQKKNWQVANGAMAETQYTVPVYRGWPDRSYNVIGSIRFVNPNKYWDDGVINMACSMAKQKGGDAIIMRYGSEFGVGMTTGSAGDPKIFTGNDITGLVIKWKTPAEIETERATLAHLTGRLNQEHPELATKKELVDLAIEFVRFQGLNLDSDEASQQLEQVLTAVAQPAKGGQAKWLFRGTVHAGSLTTSMSDTVYGVADITANGNNLTIVSTSERSDLTFSGESKDGRLSGQLSFAAGSTIISAKADGVFTDEKTTLAGQGQTPDGTFQGSFSFSR